MKTIIAAKENITKLWGFPKPKDKVYRLMKYLLRIEVDDGLLLQNNVTGKLILLTKSEAEELDKLPAKPTEQMQELISDHFLVPEDFDEYKSVNQLRKIYQSRSTGEAINHYVILPTTFCNARCFYCYESDYPRVHMTEETGRKIIDFIDKNHQDKDVLLNWFGGEPLVGIQRIDQISQGLKDRGIPFKASMISNGYLFDEEIAERSVKLWNLQRIQITLDGTEEVYNRVKAYTNTKENPYQRVLRNVDLLRSKGVQVNIRLNVDFYNKDNILELIEELGKKYSGSDHFSVYLNILFNDQGFDPIHHSQEDIVKLMEIVDTYTERLKELKIVHDRLKIPSLQVSQCMADSPHTIEIQPDGSFCRCEHESIRDSYGNLDEGILDPQKPMKWKETIERTDHCPECSLYPACYMLKYCMNAGEPCIDSFVLRSQKLLKDKLKQHYLRSMEDEKHEGL